MTGGCVQFDVLFFLRPLSSFFSLPPLLLLSSSPRLPTAWRSNLATAALPPSGGKGTECFSLAHDLCYSSFFFHFSHAVATAQFLCSPSLYLSPLRSIDSGGGFSIVAHGRESRVVGSALTSLPRQKKKREQDERRGRDYGRVSRVVVLVVVVGYSLHSLEQMELLIVGGSMVAEGLKKKSRKHKHASC